MPVERNSYINLSKNLSSNITQLFQSSSLIDKMLLNVLLKSPITLSLILQSIIDLEK